MGNEQTVEIKYNKKKLISFLILYLIMIGGGIVLLIFKSSNLLLLKFPFIRYLTSAMLVSLGIFGIYSFRKYFHSTNTPIIINKNGIQLNYQNINISQVHWKEISEIKRTSKFSKEKLILIILKNPIYYIEKQENKRCKKLLNNNQNQYGTPITISTDILDIKFNSLKNLLEENFQLNS